MPIDAVIDDQIQIASISLSGALSGERPVAIYDGLG